MRLTLRTLLAYLDDVLEPAQAKEIGQKIKESSVATELVERIREVMRRRRLGAPDVEDEGKQTNANTIAEYLDNVLTPDQVTQLERVCLESDVNLAEVAAAHQILSLVLGEPVSVSAATKERMYALAGTVKPGDSKVGIPTMSEPPATAAERVKSLAGSGVIPKGAIPPESPATNASREENDERMTVPDEIRPTPMWRRALPLVALATIVGIWFGVSFNDPALWNGIANKRGSDAGEKLTQKDTPAAPEMKKEETEVAKQEEVAATEKTPAEKTPVEVAAISPKEGGTTEAVPNEDPVKLSDEGEAGPPKLSDEESMPEETEEGERTPKLAAEPAEAKPETTKPETPKLADEESEEMPAEGSEAPGPKPDPELTEVASTTPTGDGKARMPTVKEREEEKPAAEVRPATAAEYRSVDGILLSKEKAEGAWKVKPHHASIRDGELLAVPDPFDATLNLPGSGNSLNLQSKTVLQWIGPKGKADAGFVLKRGMVALRPQTGDKQADEGGLNPAAMSVTVTSGLDSWLVEVLSPDTVSGIEVIPYEPQKFEEGVKPDGAQVLLCVAKGTVRFARIDGPVTEDQFRVVDGPMTMPLPSKYRDGEGGAVDVLLSELTGEQLPGGQRIQGGKLTLGYEWLNDQRTAATKNRNAKPFEKEFGRAIDEAIEPVMLQVSKDKVALLAKLAATALGLVGDHASLVQILQKTDHAEVRREAIEGLRIWLAEAPENGRILRDDLEGHFSPEEAKVLYELLWGYDLSAGTDPKISATLVELLDHPNDSIRELAFLHVKRLTNGRQNDYRPNSPPAVREAAVKNWKRYLEKNHGTLAVIPPVPAEGPPPGAAGTTGIPPAAEPKQVPKPVLKTPRE